MGRKGAFWRLRHSFCDGRWRCVFAALAWKAWRVSFVLGGAARRLDLEAKAGGPCVILRVQADGGAERGWTVVGVEQPRRQAVFGARKPQQG